MPTGDLNLPTELFLYDSHFNVVCSTWCSEYWESPRDRLLAETGFVSTLPSGAVRPSMQKLRVWVIFNYFTISRRGAPMTTMLLAFPTFILPLQIVVNQTWNPSTDRESSATHDGEGAGRNSLAKSHRTLEPGVVLSATWSSELVMPA